MRFLRSFYKDLKVIDVGLRVSIVNLLDLVKQGVYGETEEGRTPGAALLDSPAKRDPMGRFTA